MTHGNQCVSLGDYSRNSIILNIHEDAIAVAYTNAYENRKEWRNIVPISDTPDWVKQQQEDELK